MLFTHSFHPAIAAGTITTTYRAWNSARVKVGNTYRLNAEGVVAVDEVRETRLAEISEADALASAFAAGDALLEQLFASQDVTPGADGVPGPLPLPAGAARPVRRCLGGGV